MATANVISFLALPVEIHLLIIPLLDPIALIAFAQTNSYLRKTISPQRVHFIERLLALEIIPLHGGATPLIDVYGTSVTPSFDDLTAWDEIRYACASCIRLKRHTAFSNPSILRLRTRKPPTDSRAAQELTSWNAPCALRVAYLRRQAIKFVLANEAKTQSANYLAAKEDQDADLQSWLVSHGHTPPSAFIALRVSRAEAQLAGTQRYRRTCNECRFARGDFIRHEINRNVNRRFNCGANSGDSATPVIASRPRTFGDSIARYFPELISGTSSADGSEVDTFPVRRKIYRTGRRFDIWRTYCVRCPECEVWQELSAFRRGGARHYKAKPCDPPSWNISVTDGWTPQFENWRCHTCVFTTAEKSEEGSGEAVLGRELLEFWHSIVASELSLLWFADLHGWQWWQRYFGQHMRHLSTGCDAWDVAWDEAWAPSDTYERGDLLEALDPMIKRAKFASWSRWVEEVMKPAGEWDSRDTPGMPFIKEWYENFSARQRRSEVLKEATEKFDTEPALLVEWALRGKGRVEM